MRAMVLVGIVVTLAVTASPASAATKKKESTPAAQCILKMYGAAANKSNKEIFLLIPSYFNAENALRNATSHTGREWPEVSPEIQGKSRKKLDSVIWEHVVPGIKSATTKPPKIVHEYDRAKEHHIVVEAASGKIDFTLGDTGCQVIDVKKSGFSLRFQLLKFMKRFLDGELPELPKKK